MIIRINIKGEKKGKKANQSMFPIAYKKEKNYRVHINLEEKELMTGKKR